MKLKKIFLNSVLLIIILCSFSSCSKNNGNLNEKKSPGKFEWKNELNVNDIPNLLVSGFLNGRDVKFEYINFEKWRGTNDNVLNFSLSKPEQNCGFIENFQGFKLTRKAGSFENGVLNKDNFNSENKNLIAEFFYLNADGSIVKFSSKWCGSVVIENFDNKKALGKIALCFDDDKKSWIAGKFEALICNN